MSLELRMTTGFWLVGCVVGVKLADGRQQAWLIFELAALTIPSLCAVAPFTHPDRFWSFFKHTKFDFQYLAWYSKKSAFCWVIESPLKSPLRLHSLTLFYFPKFMNNTIWPSISLLRFTPICFLGAHSKQFEKPFAPSLIGGFLFPKSFLTHNWHSISLLKFNGIRFFCAR